MSEYAKAINAHYGQEDLSAKILTALQGAGKDIDRLTREDLASFDEHHGGGREATRELAGIAGLHEDMHVLDVGSGIGGPARTLAAEFGCLVVGLELADAFCDAAAMLTNRVGLGDQVTFEQGSALDMPLDDCAFDAVWMQDVMMNIEDKPRLFGEVYRVLKPGGRFAFQASMVGGVSGVHYPTFWADDSRLSFLTPPEECRVLLSTLGFTELTWQDTTAQVVDQSRGYFRSGAEEAKLEDGPPLLGLGVIVETDLEERIANMIRNFAENRLAKIVAIFERPKQEGA